MIDWLKTVSSGDRKNKTESNAYLGFQALPGRRAVSILETVARTAQSVRVLCTALSHSVATPAERKSLTLPTTEMPNSVHCEYSSTSLLGLRQIATSAYRPDRRATARPQLPGRPAEQNSSSVASGYCCRLRLSVISTFRYDERKLLSSLYDVIQCTEHTEGFWTLEWAVRLLLVVVM